MIVNNNGNPERDVYYLGAKVIELLPNKDSFEFFEIFEKLSQTEKITVQLYVLVLDWLFLLGVIKKDKKGLLKKCF